MKISVEKVTISTPFILAVPLNQLDWSYIAARTGLYFFKQYYRETVAPDYLDVYLMVLILFVRGGSKKIIVLKASVSSIPIQKMQFTGKC